MMKEGESMFRLKLSTSVRSIVVKGSACREKESLLHKMSTTICKNHALVLVEGL